MASGVGDLAPASAASAIDGRSLAPPSPVHLTAAALPGGDVEIRWVRRSRMGWAWTSGADTPLGEEIERYQLTIAGAGFERQFDSAVACHIYTVAEQIEDGASPPYTISVWQIGFAAPSRPSSIIFE